jgi:hypothetical protein
LHVTKAQAARIGEALFPPTNYLIRLRNRMHACGFPHDDPLYQLVCKAYDAMNTLRMHVHHLAAEGAGRPSMPPPGESAG